MCQYTGRTIYRVKHCDGKKATKIRYCSHYRHDNHTITTFLAILYWISHKEAPSH